VAKDWGDEVALPAGRNDLLARVTLQSFVPIDHLEIVRNGEVVAEIPLSGERTTVSKTLRVPARESGWYILRARGDRPAYPVLDIHPYATTSPIYVTVGGQPIRSRADAEYFLAWIDRLESAALAHRDWNTEQEKASALATIRQGRAEFEVRRHP